MFDKIENVIVFNSNARTHMCGAGVEKERKIRIIQFEPLKIHEVFSDDEAYTLKA